MKERDRFIHEHIELATPFVAQLGNQRMQERELSIVEDRLVPKAVLEHDDGRTTGPLAEVFVAVFPS